MSVVCFTNQSVVLLVKFLFISECLYITNFISWYLHLWISRALCIMLKEVLRAIVQIHLGQNCIMPREPYGPLAQGLWQTENFDNPRFSFKKKSPYNFKDGYLKMCWQKKIRKEDAIKRVNKHILTLFLKERTVIISIL